MSKINLGQETAQAIVNQEPKETIVNMPTVEDVKNIANGDAVSNLIKKIAAGTPDVKLTYEDGVYKITDEDLEKLKKYPLIVFFVNGGVGYTGAPISAITLCKNVPDSNYFAISHINLFPNSYEAKFATVVQIEFSENVLVPYEMNGDYLTPLDSGLSEYYSLEFYGIE